MVWAMVTPPLSAVRMAVSSALTTAPTSASGVMASEPSFVPAMAMWVWESIRPGTTKRPAASITFTPAGGAILRPIWRMIPPRTRMSPFAMIPFVTVRIVPFLMRRSAPAAAGDRAGRSKPETQEAGEISVLMGLLRVFDQHAVDEDLFDLGLLVEYFTLGQDDIGDLARLETAELGGDAEILGRGQGQSLERLVPGQAGFDRALDALEGRGRVAQPSVVRANLTPSLARFAALAG